MSTLRASVVLGLVIGCGGKTTSSADTPPPAPSASAVPAGSPRASASASNPGRVTCGASECDLRAGEGCCTSTNPPTCSTTCQSWTCDEAADCAAGEVCCAGGSSGGPDRRVCATAPCTTVYGADYPGGESVPLDQFCKLASECAHGLTCRNGICQSP